MREIGAFVARSVELQNQLWHHAVTVTAAAPQSLPLSLRRLATTKVGNWLQIDLRSVQPR